MSDETPAAVEPTSWPMTPQEARDLAFLRKEADQIQRAFGMVGSAFQRRLGLPDGKYRYDLDACVWVREG